MLANPLVLPIGLVSMESWHNVAETDEVLWARRFLQPTCQCRLGLASSDFRSLSQWHLLWLMKVRKYESNLPVGCLRHCDCCVSVCSEVMVIYREMYEKCGSWVETEEPHVGKVRL
jgi:hypothetical protein